MKSHSLPSRYRSWRAFTLIELLVVMTVMAILIGAAVPMLQGDGAAKLRTSVRRAGALFEQGRSLALTRSQPVRVMVLEDSSDDERHRREMAIAIAKEEDVWEIAWGPEFLPEGVFFDASQPGIPPETMVVESGSRGARPWRYYEVGSNGTFSGNSPNFVVALGFSEGGAVTVPNTKHVDGFRITAAARPFYFRTPEEIPKNLPGS